MEDKKPLYTTVQQEIAKLLHSLLQNDAVFAPLFASETFEEKALLPTALPLEKHKADFALQLPFHAAKALRRSPIELGKRLQEMLQAKYTDSKKDFLFESVQFAPPGFVNLKLSSPWRTRKICQLHTCALRCETLLGKRIHLEYVSANPTGPLHVGQGRWAAVGSALAAILKNCGAKVHQEFYVNDAGSQIDRLNATAKALGQKEAVPEDGYHGDYMKALAGNANPAKELLAQQKKHLAKMGAKFDEYFHESTLAKKNEDQTSAVQDVLAYLEKIGLAYRLQGALWFASSKGGDDKDRVLVKSNGEKTYFAMDVAYHFSKIKRGYTDLIDILGADHHGYVSRIETASRLMFQSLQSKTAQKLSADPAENAGKVQSSEEKAIGIEMPDKKEFSIRILIGQLVSLFRGGEEIRMSKRSGEFVLMNDVVEEIGVDAFRYFLLAQSINKRIDFDLDLARAKSNDNPVYYLQYAHARSASLLAKGIAMGVKPVEDEKLDLGLVYCDRLAVLTNAMLVFHSEIAAIGNSLHVHHLPHMLHELASHFHSLYNARQFIRVETQREKEESAQYLWLTACFKRLLAHGLGLLGISAPQRM